MEPESTVESRRIYQGRVLGLRVDRVRLATGRETTREIVEHGESVVVVPVDGEGNVLLVRQYRKAPGQFLLEVVAGGIEEGESPQEGALRELQEETGCIAGRIRKLGAFWVAPGYSTEYMHAYLATDLSQGKLQQAEDEDIEVVRVPLAQIPQMIRSGEMADAHSVAALLMVLHMYSEELG